MAIDSRRAAQDGWLSVIGQRGKTVTVVDYSFGGHLGNECDLRDGKSVTNGPREN
jgi:hypothetical protein